jgi:hypothetical protein
MVKMAKYAVSLPKNATGMQKKHGLPRNRQSLKAGRSRLLKAEPAAGGYSW